MPRWFQSTGPGPPGPFQLLRSPARGCHRVPVRADPDRADPARADPVVLILPTRASGLRALLAGIGTRRTRPMPNSPATSIPAVVDAHRTRFKVTVSPSPCATRIRLTAKTLARRSWSACGCTRHALWIRNGSKTVCSQDDLGHQVERGQPHSLVGLKVGCTQLQHPLSALAVVRSIRAPTRACRPPSGPPRPPGLS